LDKCRCSSHKVLASDKVPRDAPIPSEGSQQLGVRIFFI
jgi:hypothetical protein